MTLPIPTQTTQYLIDETNIITIFIKRNVFINNIFIYICDMKNTKINIGSKLKQAREQKGAKVSDIAKALDVTTQRIYAIERSEAVSSSVIKSYAKAINVPYISFIGDIPLV